MAFINRGAKVLKSIFARLETLAAPFAGFSALNMLFMNAFSTQA